MLACASLLLLTQLLGPMLQAVHLGHDHADEVAIAIVHDAGGEPASEPGEQPDHRGNDCDFCRLLTSLHQTLPPSPLVTTITSAAEFLHTPPADLCLSAASLSCTAPRAPPFVA